MKETIRDRLIEVAKNRMVVFYAEIGELLDFSMDNPHHRRELGRILGEISTDEDRSGSPLLSAIVVHKDNHLPGKGFFELARELGKLKPGEDNDAFYASELKSVFEEWSSKKSTTKIGEYNQ